MSPHWKPLSIAPVTLAEARKELHWASQVAAASADACIEHRADDSHTNLHWDDASTSLVGNPLPLGHRIAIDLTAFAVHLQKDSKTIEQFALAGHSLDETFAWLASALSRAMDKDVVLSRRDYEMPEHPVSTGGRFSRTLSSPLAELGRHFANADLCLKALAATDTRATSVAVWPHHFDMGGIFILDADKPFEEAPQIGFGMSPGDAAIQEPYYYITPWPLPEGPPPNFAAPGRWETQAFNGILLLSSELIELGIDAQEKALRSFLSSAITTSLTHLSY